MPVVSITLGKREYQLMCGEGQEESLRKLAAEVSGRISMLAKSMPEANDTLLLVMNSLMMQDEVNEIKENSSEKKTASSEEEINAAISDALMAISEYVESIAERVEKA